MENLTKKRIIIYAGIAVLAVALIILIIILATGTGGGEEPVSSPLPTMVTTPAVTVPAATPAAESPAITPPASDGSDPASGSDIVLATERPSTDTDFVVTTTPPLPEEAVAPE